MTSPGLVQICQCFFGRSYLRLCNDVWRQITPTKSRRISARIYTLIPRKRLCLYWEMLFFCRFLRPSKSRTYRFCSLLLMEIGESVVWIFLTWAKPTWINVRVSVCLSIKFYSYYINCFCHDVFNIIFIYMKTFLPACWQIVWLLWLYKIILLG